MRGYCGADPDGLLALAASVERRVAIAARRAREAHSLLRHFGRGGDADRIGAALSRRAQLLAQSAGDLTRRADLIRDAERLLPGGGALPTAVTFDAWLRAEHALVAPFGLTDWAGHYLAWRDGPQPGSIAGLDPADALTTLEGISPHARHRLVLAHPELIGRLDGAPAEMRYAANRILIRREISGLESMADALTSDSIDSVNGGAIHWSEMWRELLADERAGIAERIARYRLWLDEDRQILLFDPAGDGLVVEVFGDLEEAHHVGVVVPGMSNDIGNFGPVDGDGFRANADDLKAAAAVFDERVATVAWLGYDTPDGADAGVRNAAQEGHDGLVRFVAGLVAADDRHVTVIGHSYGSLVTGMASRVGLAADELVFVGSPGTSLDHAGDANLPPGGEVWAGLASWDPIGAGVSLTPSDLWDGSLSVPGRYLFDLITTGDLAAEELWHGTNPVHEKFGAVEFTTDGATGHSQYFDPGTESLENLARIVAGHTAQVTVVSSEPFELAPGPFGYPSIDPAAEVA